MIQFFIYFIKLRVKLALGFYSTTNPTDIRWRWKHWRKIKSNRLNQRL
jgi:hypothetical protein